MENKSDKRIDLVIRMIKAFNKNRNKIEGTPKQKPLTPNQKRMRKIYDLLSRSGADGEISWKNLR